MAVIINLESKSEDGPDKPSYEDVLTLANGLSNGSHSKDVTDVLRAAALAQLDPVDIETILVAIQAKTKLSKKPLLQNLQMIQTPKPCNLWKIFKKFASNN